MTTTGLILAGWMSASAFQSPTLHLNYRGASEDDASTGRLALPLTPGKPVTAVVAESDCRVSGRANADAPEGDADQFWSFRIELTKDAKGRPAARIRHRVVKPSGPGPEQDRLLVLDGKDTLVIDAFSARTDCRYDRVHLTVSGG